MASHSSKLAVSVSCFVFGGRQGDDPRLGTKDTRKCLKQNVDTWSHMNLGGGDRRLLRSSIFLLNQCLWRSFPCSTSQSPKNPRILKKKEKKENVLAKGKCFRKITTFKPYLTRDRERCHRRNNCNGWNFYESTGPGPCSHSPSLFKVCASLNRSPQHIGCRRRQLRGGRHCSLCLQGAKNTQGLWGNEGRRTVFIGSLGRKIHSLSHCLIHA